MAKEITRELVRRLMPARPKDANKGSFGKVAAVAGSMAYRGAAALCVEGALRAGAGLVYLASVEPVVQLTLTRTPECCACGCRADAQGGIHPKEIATLRQFFEKSAPPPVLLAGPGLGQNAGAILAELLKGSWRGAVLDADALNALAAGQIKWEKFAPSQAVLTPHPGEAARLLGRTVADIQADRERAARDLAQKYGCCAVLKGAGTLVAAADGTLYRNTTGNAGLARGGSGDVLAGIMAALLAQGLAPAEAAVCAVWLHGAAADRCASRLGELSMLPHDILQDLGTLL